MKVFDRAFATHEYTDEQMCEINLHDSRKLYQTSHSHFPPEVHYPKFAESNPADRHS